MDEIERRAQNAARQKRASVSRRVAQDVKQKPDNTWPPEFIAAAGSCPDFPEVEELRKGYGPDAPRESMD
jgi:hypothetical protein